MRWPPWSKSPDDTGGAEAEREAARRLRDVRERWPEVDRVTEELQRHRVENHFAAKVLGVWRGHS